MTSLDSIDHSDQSSVGVKPPPLGLIEKIWSVVACNPKLHTVILVVLPCCCFFRTLGSYFIADDFPEIAYISGVFHGRTDLFFSNFTGNYMQVSGMKVYRPGMFLTMVIDFLCYGAKAWGYLLTNSLYFTGDVVALYFLCRSLTKNWPLKNSALFALFSAAFFAVNPLHCETISWMVGRGDPISAFFYLLSLVFFVHSLSKPGIALKTASLALFAIALSIKEMPVALPVVTSVLPVFWLNDTTTRKRLAAAFRFSLPFWITVAVYFVIRYLCLGTIGGGYVGGVGAQQLSAMLRHWADLDTIQRMFIPVTQELATQSVLSLSALRALNIVAVSLACLRLLSGCWSWRWTCLMAVLLFTTAVPIFQLWGIGPNLEGGRFYFYLSLPLSMLLPLMLFHPQENQSPIFGILKAAINPGKYGLALTVFSIFIQIALVALLGRTTSKTNMLWVHAGKEDFHLAQECQKLASQTNKEKRILVLGIPDDYHGAHLILNSTMFNEMLRPPFVQNAVADRFLTTMPFMYGPEQYVNGTRLKELLSAPNVVGPYVWLRDKEKFQKVDLLCTAHHADCILVPPAIYSTPYVRKDRHASQLYSVFLDNLDIDPLAIDSIELELDTKQSSDEPLKVYWNGELPISDEAKDDFHAEQFLKSARAKSITVRLGHYWRWYACGRIKSIELVFPHAEEYQIRSIRLLPPSVSAPVLTLKSGNKYTTEISSKPIELSLDAGHVPGVASLQLEIGKGNYFFDNFQGKDEQEAVAFKLPLSASSKSFSLDSSSKYFPYPGYYQVRLRCLDQHGIPVGEYSDPVSLWR